MNGQHGPWAVWVVPSSNQDPIGTSYRMCASCGYTHWTDTQQEGWVEVPGSVVGTSCTDRPLDATQTGFATPAPTP